VKLLTSMPKAAQLSPFLGGAEFDYAVSTNDEATTQKEGCRTKGCTEDLTPEEAAYNVLGDFFFGTLAAGHYGGQAPAPPYASPIHFLNMDYRDIGYAASHPCPCTCSKVIACASMQDLISLASRDLSATAGKSRLGPPLSPSCTKPLVPCPPQSVAPARAANFGGRVGQLAGGA
jgi:hypothetical protein